MNLVRRRLIIGLSLSAIAGKLPLMATSGDTIYVVRKGDTLSEIAQKFGVSISALRRENAIRGDLILIGQKLRIPVVSTSATRLSELMRGVKLNRGRWKYIIGHHSATKHGNAAVYDRNHRRRGMENGLAYHFVIGNGVDSIDGGIEVGTRWKQQIHGGHVKKYEMNKVGIGICVIGNFEETRPTVKQVRSFEALVGFLGNDVLRGNYTFKVHKEVDRNHTVCPGKYFPVKRMHRLFG